MPSSILNSDVESLDVLSLKVYPSHSSCQASPQRCRLHSTRDAAATGVDAGHILQALQVVPACLQPQVKAGMLLPGVVLQKCSGNFVQIPFAHWHMHAASGSPCHTATWPVVYLSHPAHCSVHTQRALHSSLSILYSLPYLPPSLSMNRLCCACQWPCMPPANPARS